ncbi:hypothetical protein AGLY_017066 [Aphis glycines]|uniref:Uncharacterized protein n=1 Tax=Aphis glycines TaxID=307491 RepID=A0A6G0SWS5_APHGL|nr:hypothetical protein AGLY_017066 [Aphis glycines]
MSGYSALHVVKKRIRSSSWVASPPVILPSTSSSLYGLSTSSGTGTKRCSKERFQTLHYLWKLKAQQTLLGLQKQKREFRPLRFLQRKEENQRMMMTNLWLRDPKCPPSSFDVNVAKKILVEVGRQFCYLVKEKNKALTLSPYFQSKPITWKKAVNSVREVCDVCFTTIFNYHWTSTKCGFRVCIDCVKARLNGSSKSPNAATMTKKDTFMWMTCNSEHTHDVARLMLAQIVVSDSTE